VLYDARKESPTHARLIELHTGEARPAFVVIPPGVWHGLKNLGPGDALLLNCPTIAYDYEDPDHYRLPYDTSEIPYHWGAVTTSRLRSDGR
jgi:dTDP-4-dehydrorhamnose 3,5-epimerase